MIDKISNVSMQLLRYPPILPIVYYEGSGKWTAPCNIKDRIYFDEALEPFTPKFSYKLIQLNDYSVDELHDIIARVTASMLRHLHLPEDEVSEFTDQVKERDMAVLFEHFEDIDLPAERKKAREEGLAEGRAEGHAEGLAEGLAVGQERLRQLTKVLIEQKRIEDLERSTRDSKFMEEMLREFNI